MAFTGDPRHFTLRSAREEASKLANVERRARDETRVQEKRFCPFTNRFGVECSFAMPSEWPFRSVEKADPDGYCFYHAVGMSFEMDGKQLHQSASEWVRTQLKSGKGPDL
jgi:hypothetical protein